MGKGEIGAQEREEEEREEKEKEIIISKYRRQRQYNGQVVTEN